MSEILTIDSALDALMKRTTAREMFRLTDAYFLDASRSPSKREPFILLPRFNACVRLNADAIRLYFDHIHAHRSRRAKVFRVALLALASIPDVIARVAPGFSLYDPAEKYPSTDWSTIDVLLAEWQFVGVFSGADQTVSHILTDSRYERCFQNEIEARATMRPFVPLPRVLRVEREKSRGWTEEFFPNEATLSERQEPFSDLQAAMCTAYVETGKPVATGIYLADLSTRVNQRYPAGSNDEVAEALRKLIDWAGRQAAREGVATFQIARGHGDFNPGQVLSTSDKHVLIDWSESERGVTFHDYVHSALWYYRWRELAVPIDVPALHTMRSCLKGSLSQVSPLLAVALVLIEVGVKQHVDYIGNGGTVRSWTTLASQTLAITNVSTTHQNVTAHHPRDESRVQS